MDAELKLHAGVEDGFGSDHIICYQGSDDDRGILVEAHTSVTVELK
jgi:hypothetical protein